MAYVPVPKDLTKVKTKVAFNLTKRQLVCFGGGALIGVPLFFLLRGPWFADRGNWGGFSLPPGACGKQRGCYVYDAGHAALLSDGNV